MLGLLQSPLTNARLQDPTSMTSLKKIAMLGAAGYVAPKHMKPIKETGQNLVAALDPSDSVCILDSFSYNVPFFTERFDRHAEKLRRLGETEKYHYISLCAPNYLHDAYFRFTLRIGSNTICEKQLVRNPCKLDALAELEKETGLRIFNVLQLRFHPSIIALKEKIETTMLPKDYKRKIDLAYINSREKWYIHSWKGNINKSGGVVTNIVIHSFDMLMWIFVSVRLQEIHFSNQKKMAGYLELENARILWFCLLTGTIYQKSLKRREKQCIDPLL